MKFIITIDTEGDNQWDHGRNLTVENIKFVPRFQELCKKYKIIPTYLVTSEVCDDSFAREIFTEYLTKGTAEIGAHLHSWTTPPFLDMEGFKFNDVNHAFATELPDHLINKKIKYLTDQIEASFGSRPFSFRSGRFGFNETVAKILIGNSYLVDSSITPYTNWSGSKGVPQGIGGPDFSEKRPFPTEYSFTGKSLLEIPVTIVPTVFPLDKNIGIVQYYFRNVDRTLILRKLKSLFYKDQPLWLRPFDWTTNIQFNQIIDKAFSIKMPFLVMMFHSSELMPGCSIYRKDRDSIERLFDQLEYLFILLEEKKIGSLSLTEAAKCYYKTECK